MNLAPKLCIRTENHKERSWTFFSPFWELEDYSDVLIVTESLRMYGSTCMHTHVSAEKTCMHAYFLQHIA